MVPARDYEPTRRLQCRSWALVDITIILMKKGEFCFGREEKVPYLYIKKTEIYFPLLFLILKF
jgi:hypothetical protein